MKLNLLFVVLLLVFFCTILSNGFASSIAPQEPYKRMLDEPTSFAGVEDKTHNTGIEPITIGLFVPSSPNDEIGRAVFQAAQLVIKKANLAGGYNGVPFKLAHRWTERPWTAGPSEILKLVYQDKAVAIITSLSTESHIAAQIAAKSYIPIISVASSDATLTQARVPWIFRLPPDDLNQAKTLLKACIKNNSCQAGLISTTDQDSRIGADIIEKEFDKQNIPLLYHFQVNTNERDWEGVINRISAQDPEVLFIKTTEQIVTKITSLLQQKNLVPQLFLTWTPGLDISKLANSYQGKFSILSPISEPANKVIPSNQNQLSDTNSLPVYFLAIDAVQMAVNSVLLNGPSRTSIRKSIAEMTIYQGVSGRYVFNNGGANTSTPTLIEIH